MDDDVVEDKKVFMRFWVDDDGVDECDVEDDEQEWGRRRRKEKLINFCWLTVRENRHS